MHTEIHRVIRLRSYTSVKVPLSRSDRHRPDGPFPRSLRPGAAGGDLSLVGSTSLGAVWLTTQRPAIAIQSESSMVLPATIVGRLFSHATAVWPTGNQGPSGRRKATWDESTFQA